MPGANVQSSAGELSRLPNLKPVSEEPSEIAQRMAVLAGLRKSVRQGFQLGSDYKAVCIKPRLSHLCSGGQSIGVPGTWPSLRVCQLLTQRMPVQLSSSVKDKIILSDIFFATQFLTGAAWNNGMVEKSVSKHMRSCKFKIHSLVRFVFRGFFFFDIEVNSKCPLIGLVLILYETELWW